MSEAEHLALLAAVIYAGSVASFLGPMRGPKALDQALEDARYLRNKASGVHPLCPNCGGVLVDTDSGYQLCMLCNYGKPPKETP